MPLSVLASIGVPTPDQCFRVLGPIAGLIFLRWVIRNSDNVVRRLFPTLEWQTQLGWLNIRAQRRADAFWRWIDYGTYATLLLSLCGFIWSAYNLSHLPPSPADLPAILPILPILLLSIVFWAAYFACSLFPRLLREYEREDLERFRAETPPPDQDRPSPRLPAHSPLVSRSRFPARR